MAQYKKAGADAAGEYDDYFRQIIANDPDVQRTIQRVWGTTPLDQRPSDTPKHLEKANDAASKEIAQILKRKGIALPDRTFVNPRTGSLEGHRGWSGLSGLQKAAIIAAAGAGGLGALAATGALAGGAAGGATAAGTGGIGVTTGVPAGMAGVGATGVTAGAGGGSLLGGMLTNAGINAGLTKATGGSWKDALISGGTGALTGGGNMGWGQTLANLGKSAAQQYGGNLMQQLLSGNALDAAGRGLGGVAATQAYNRGVTLDAMMAGDEMALAADRERRADEAEILRKIQQTSYLQSGGAGDLKPSVSVSGKPLGQFDFGVRPPTAAEVAAAGVLEGQLMDRLRNPRKLRDYDSKMEPGGMETALNWISPALSTLGAARGAGQYQGPLASAARPTQTPTPTNTPTEIAQAPASRYSVFNPARPAQARNPWATRLIGE